MSLHDVVLHLLHKGLPTSETERDELIARVEDDRAAQAAKDRPSVVAQPEAASPAPPRFDPTTGARIE